MEEDKPWSPANFQETLIISFMLVISPKGQLLLKTRIIQKNLLSRQMQSRCSKGGNSFSEVKVVVENESSSHRGTKDTQLHHDDPRSCKSQLQQSYWLQLFWKLKHEV